MRVENPKLVVEPGTGRTGKLAMVAYQFQQHACRIVALAALVAVVLAKIAIFTANSEY
jgi:hypothetical protein